MGKEHLGELEELVLLIITILKDDAYGLAIRNQMKEQANRQVTIGAVHGTVNRLEKKGFVTSKLGGASEVRGGRRKRLFELTALGQHMLEKSQAEKLALWNKIPSLAIMHNN